MATGWVKSLQCKSRAIDDVIHNHKNVIRTSSSCRKSVQSLRDVVETTKQKPRKKPIPPPPPSSSSSPSPPPGKVEAGSERVRPRKSTRHSRAPDPVFPALAELPEGHPSRNVVEIIFHTRWAQKEFPGRVEMVFKVQNLTRTVTRFEEYREVVRGGAAVGDGGFEEHARCMADGNEVMRFQCLGPISRGLGYDGAWNFHGGKGAICTFSESGGAHDSAGGGRGRRAMLVCRVIAGRVRKQIGFDSLLEGRIGFDSVSGENGELLVFDSRAVLPCFLIIYKL